MQNNQNSPPNRGAFKDSRTFDKWVNNHAIDHEKKNFQESFSYHKFDLLKILQDQNYAEECLDNMVQKLAEKSERYRNLSNLNDRNQRKIWVSMTNYLEKKCKDYCLSSGIEIPMK